MRKVKFINGGFYHIFNRGTDKRTIFADNYDFERFLQGMREFNSLKPIGSIYENSFRNQLRFPTPKLVNIVAYCLNPNHFHLILEQTKNGGISEYLKKIGGGYANYFNAKYKRSGTLFQGRFKSIYIDSNTYLLHLSAYVNLNNKVHKIKDQKFRSSWAEYIGDSNTRLCNPKIILDQFKNQKEYRDFAESSLLDMLQRKEMRKEMESLLLE
ncbi:hypothetical protein A2662_04380 [Candidatus Giovannonibacteria bacterium RIFCSPHIGHO2_01_FULL_45_33]|uniref:Transposase IS200-like domain-containing protein n=1 Tax=Candidatus Giovannonibacteria bacterium RIFCSPLOWO2_01_FULL_45_34 TaxID=1798351 RepID=A0A1F5X1B3_9BACT|nr:MAG: hypothetical protein A2662_04380 [Candidatus Giovannonibacteria bacterium RIFCSPHIGHO2_01_FULL_45_33]OGF70196.1 MAG: hypothetical protein A3C73_04500 [Candidatus Giovannonibacteria bacterium RIFCSPHIGHO2_02_FULL_44_11]OGF81361.1 MAG: hypothetical protein A2930_00605 [Candidatus Giovannonibacteria bacterium RIFCSPLOWO2_01_FULL_45_34]